MNRDPLKIPSAFEEILKKDRNLNGAVESFVAGVTTLLDDNKLPFFPNFTDHGRDHIQRVLATELKLIPDDVFRLEILSPADMAVLICGTLLHDIAMHMREAGFLDLVNGLTGHRPVDWFDRQQGTRPPDRPWPELWEEFQREAKRFSDRDLNAILGPPSPIWGTLEFPEHPGDWKQRHYLFIGEFLRRHHARLAHEIAIHGFPGLDDSTEIPSLASSISNLADLAGLVARSHGMSLRTCTDYLAYKNGNREPKRLGTVATFHMTLLRVADYLQLDADRAPAVLLQLRDPQSPISLSEWKNHGAVAHIEYDNTDPHAIRVELNGNHSLRTHLLMKDLLQGLQDEMDGSAAVLSEIYGCRSDDLRHLHLQKTRALSNIDAPALHAQLDFLPVKAELQTDPQLLGLLAGPLYGEHPEIGIRELLQNAVDAVREREQYCKSHGISEKDLDFALDDCEVLIEVKEENGKHKLVVTDNGIGMTAKTVQNYFLKAGASFRSSSFWKDEYIDEEGQSSVVRSGRFGIGVFALFLLGDHIRVTTRHIDSSRFGLTFVTLKNPEMIEISRTPAAIGTTIEVDLSTQVSDRLAKDNWDWFCHPQPKVRRTYMGKELQQETVIPESLGENLPINWAPIRTQSNQELLWSRNFGPREPIFCNGIRIAGIVNRSLISTTFDWSDTYFDEFLDKPLLSIVDPDGSLPLTLQRHGFAQIPQAESILFKDIIKDLIAFCLILARRQESPIYPTRPQSLFGIKSYPGLNKHSIETPSSWFTTEEGIGFFHPLLLNECGCRRLLSCNYLDWLKWWRHLDTCTNTAFMAPHFMFHSSAIEHLDFEDLDTAYPLKPYARFIDKWPLAEHPKSKSRSASLPTKELISFLRRGTNCPTFSLGELTADGDGLFGDLLVKTDGIFSESLGPLASLAQESSPDFTPYGVELYPDYSQFEGTTTIFLQTWLEILEQPLIPFAPEARDELIARVETKPGMRRFLDYWRSKKKN